MKKKHYIIILIMIVLVIAVAISSFFYYEHQQKSLLEKEKELVSHIKKKYNPLVITNKKSNVYKLIDNKYVKSGNIIEDTELELAEQKTVNKDTKYFKLKNIDYYISYKDIEKLEKLSKKDTNYKNYILFDENINTDKLKLYDNDKLIYELDETISLSIIIKDNDKLYVLYDNKLLYVLKNEVKEIIPIKNSEIVPASEVPVVAYHFIYDPLLDEPCNQIICHTVTQLESHLKYLSDNNYLSLSANEFELFLDKKIRVPKNTIMISIDDGWASHRATPLLEKYQKYATYFIVTSWNNKDEFISDYVGVHSHSDNLHNPGICPGGQGGAIKCLEKNKLILDLKTAREKLNNSPYFCYPYYEYNDYAINTLKEVGYTMAFAGGNVKAKQTSNKFKIPRITLLYDTTVEDLANILS